MTIVKLGAHKNSEIFNRRAKSIATTAAKVVRAESSRQSRLSPEKILRLAIDPPTVSTGEDARLSTLDPQTSLARVLTTYCFGCYNKKTPLLRAGPLI